MSSNFTPHDPVGPDITIRQGTADDADTAAGVLAEAFADDPVTRWHFPDPQRRRVLLPGFFMLFVRRALLDGGLLIAGAGQGVRIFTAPTTVSENDGTSLSFEASVAEQTGPDAARTIELLRLLDARHPQDEPHYHLVFSAVPRQLQGSGIGTATLRHVLRRADVDQVGVYVESSTPRSQRLVMRHGFTPLAPITLPGGPSLYPSWRAPAR